MKKSFKTLTVAAALSALFSLGTQASGAVPSDDGRDYLFSLQSVDGHGGTSLWEMKKASEVSARAEDLSKPGFGTEGWMPAVVPGTVLNSLVYNGVYPEPYFGLNNKLTSGLIPDISIAGRDFYTYWFRTEFDAVPVAKDERIWMQVDGVNYRAEFWLNGKMVCFVSGMFNRQFVDVTDYVSREGSNVLAVKVYPIDEPGGPRKGTSKSWGAAGEFRNGGNGEIGKNVSMLMTVGWDFTFLDGIRDRNTGIWRDIRFFRSGKVMLNHPFVKSELNEEGKGHGRDSRRRDNILQGCDCAPRSDRDSRIHSCGLPSACDGQPAPLVACEQGEAGNVHCRSESGAERRGTGFHFRPFRHQGDNIRHRHSGQVPPFLCQREADFHQRHQLDTGEHAPHLR